MWGVQHYEFYYSVHGAESYGLDCGTVASEWLDDFLGKSGHRLLYSSPSIYRRPAKTCNTKYVAWTDFIDENMKVNIASICAHFILYNYYKNAVEV